MEQHSKVDMVVEPIMVPDMATLAILDMVTRATVTQAMATQDTQAVLTAIRGMEDRDMELMDMATILETLATTQVAMAPTMERIMANMVNI